ncbi:hypothetical protein CTAYLR_007396 [Chrysophaeum taylorii]|uniref:Uncharacterized protein n=1 Tax=Chrysophaeum taylorii TaxID=2483200 RepID=A0AAD7XH45_9STRA|nr:hypothetical protein CTAYLR_007396 [Chrysophaeum taylorii]
MMRLAVEDVRAALRSELDAARDRAAETALSVEAYRHWETAKRNRAATERELMASLSSVATLTPEAEISDRLAAVADAKAEIIAVDSAIADELNDAIAFLEDAAETADHDRTRVERVLESRVLRLYRSHSTRRLPDSAAEATAFRIFEWDDIDHARELVETARRRAALATEAARRLDQIIHKSTSLRSRAVTTVAGPAADDDDDDDLPTFKQAAKEVATAGLESAAAFGDWVLSDQPEELAQTIADRLRARVS